jgi:hypothetical protein
MTGFMNNYLELYSTNKCVALVDGATSYIHSPNYPGTYPRNSASVEHQLLVNSGTRVKLTVTMMELAQGDTVTIYNGYCSSWSSTILETFKGSHPNIQKIYFSTGDAMCISLDASKGYGRGFSMKVEGKLYCILLIFVMSRRRSFHAQFISVLINTGIYFAVYLMFLEGFTY